MQTLRQHAIALVGALALGGLGVNAALAADVAVPPGPPSYGPPVYRGDYAPRPVDPYPFPPPVVYGYPPPPPVVYYGGYGPAVVPGPYYRPYPFYRAHAYGPYPRRYWRYHY
jgi:hypothetical protein